MPNTALNPTPQSAGAHLGRGLVWRYVYMSIVSQIPIENIDKRKHVLFNSLEFTFDQIENRYCGLVGVFLRYESADQSVGVSLAWDVIDWCEKLRKLLGYGAGLKKNGEWYIEVVSNLKCVEEARHIIQHFDKNINSNLSSAQPPLGHVTALIPSNSGFNVKIMNAGSFYLEKGEEFKIGGFKMPSLIDPPVDHVTLFVGEHAVNLSELFRAIMKAKESFVKYIQKKYIEKT
jgi:hypothetical protein